MHAHLMYMKLVLLASAVHLPRINIMKRILFALKGDATLTRCPVSGGENRTARNDGRCRPRDEPIE